MKAGTLGNHLALVPKRKADWIAKSVEEKTTYHDGFIKSNDAPSATLIIDLPKDRNLRSSIKERSVWV